MPRLSPVYPEAVLDPYPYSLILYLLFVFYSLPCGANQFPLFFSELGRGGPESIPVSFRNVGLESTTLMLLGIHRMPAVLKSS